MKLIDLTGQRFRRLVVVHREGHNRWGSIKWLCQCDCGNTSVVRADSLKTGNTSSCGCNRKGVTVKRSTTHGMSYTKEYITWDNMKQRCTNSKRKDYKNYGGRGITICKEWQASFEAFYRDMGDKPKGLTLDRINVNGDYTPGNCRWATQSEQCLNQRRSLS